MVYVPKTVIVVCGEKGKIMFQVVHKETGVIRTVYAVTGIRFLLWNEQEACWEYGDMEKYKPVADCAAPPA